MQVQVKHDDGTKTDYFGISDFSTTNEGEETKIALHFHRDVPADEPHPIVEGQIIGSASEIPYNSQGAFEAIKQTASKDDHKVIVGVTDHHSAVERGVLRVLNDEDFDGDLEVIA